MGKTFLTSSINNSSTLAGKAAAEITDVRGKAIKLNSTGTYALASTEGEEVLGIALLTSGDPDGKVLINGTLEVLVKDMGVALAGAAITAGSPVMTNASGKVITATAGKFIIGYALTSATADGDYINVQVAKGYYPAD